MISLAETRDWLASLGAIEATWTIGRYETEKTKRACVYQRPTYADAEVSIGGRESTKTRTKSVQVLVHWNKNHRETEDAAQALYKALQFNPRPTIGGKQVGYIKLLLPEPADAGSDDSGIFDRVIWFEIYYEED